MRIRTETNMAKSRQQIRKQLEFFLQHSDLSTFEIADRLEINEAEITNRILEGSDSNEGN